MSVGNEEDRSGAPRKRRSVSLRPAVRSSFASVAASASASSLNFSDGNHHQQPRKKYAANQRRVHFASVRTVIPPATSDIDYDLWYHESDVSFFRKLALINTNRVKLQELDRIIREKKICGKAIPPWKLERLIGYRDRLDAENMAEEQVGECNAECNSILVEEGPGCPRGLEFRSSFERPKDRSNSIRTVLQAQEQLRRHKAGAMCKGLFDASLLLAIIASKTTRKARDLALRTAREDFLAVYGECSSRDSELSVASPRPAKRRRKVVCRGEAVDGIPEQHGQPQALPID